MQTSKVPGHPHSLVSISLVGSLDNNSNFYRKLSKFWDARNFAKVYLKFKQIGQTFRVFCQNGANGIANSEDPYQTAPLGAV